MTDGQQFKPPPGWCVAAHPQDLTTHPMRASTGPRENTFGHSDNPRSLLPVRPPKTRRTPPPPAGPADLTSRPHFGGRIRLNVAVLLRSALQPRECRRSWAPCRPRRSTRAPTRARSTPAAVRPNGRGRGCSRSVTRCNSARKITDEATSNASAMPTVIGTTRPTAVTPGQPRTGPRPAGPPARSP